MAQIMPMHKHDSGMNLLLLSCQYPAGLLDLDLASRSALHLQSTIDLCQGTDRFHLAIITGDYIYRDATAGLFDPEASTDSLARTYNRQLEGPWSHLSGIRKLHMLDDHEIVDNWEPRVNAHGQVVADPLIAPACEAYARHCRPLGPGKLPNYRYGNPLWFPHHEPQYGHRFFVLDTRTTREPRHAGNLREAQILGLAQREALYAWMDEAGDHELNFVISPAIVLPRRLRSARQFRAALHSDAWDGYPTSLHDLLAKVYEVGKHSFVFLSGDEHLAIGARITIERTDRSDAPAVTTHSIHNTALYAPFPFANSRPEKFARCETFEFESAISGNTHHYRCTVVSTFARAVDGAVTIHTRPSAEGWKVAALLRPTDAPHVSGQIAPIEPLLDFTTA